MFWKHARILLTLSRKKTINPFSSAFLHRGGDALASRGASLLRSLAVPQVSRPLVAFRARRLPVGILPPLYLPTKQKPDLPVKTGTFGCCLPPNPLRHRASRFGMPYEAWCAREGLPSPSDLPTDLILCDHTCSSE